MNKVRKLYRYWVDKDSKTIVRQWTVDEYENTDPYTHIFEEYWSYRCKILRIVPIPRIIRRELVCLESKEEFIEETGVWSHKYVYYN